MISLPASTKPAQPPAADSAPAPEPRPGWDLFYRIAGTVVGVLLGIATGVAEAVMTPLYIGSVRSPAAPLLALVGNAALVWFTWTVTRRAGLSLIPGAAWFIVMIIATSKTSEGDLVVTGTWVGLLTLLLGSVGWAVAGYLAVLRRPMPRREPGPIAPVAPAGSRPPRPGAKRNR